MTFLLYIATSIGLFIVAQNDGNWKIVSHALRGHPLTSIAASRDFIIAGANDGLWRSENGDSWQKVNTGFQVEHIRWISSSKNHGSIVFAGTEPADILISKDGGITWLLSADVGELRDANRWFLPYSPNAGCVRGFAIAVSDQRVERIYAAAEVGGVLVSRNEGKSWEMVEGSDGSPDFSRELGTMIHPDVHSISVHPKSVDIVTAPTGGGLYRSHDGGKTWKNLYRCYIRAAWVDPDDPSHIIAGPADGVSRNGRIEESTDGGKTWLPSSDGTRSPWARHMVERFYQTGSQLFAILSNGELWVRSLNEKRWQRILKEIGQVKAMASIQSAS